MISYSVWHENGMANYPPREYVGSSQINFLGYISGYLSADPKANDGEKISLPNFLRKTKKEKCALVFDFQSTWAHEYLRPYLSVIQKSFDFEIYDIKEFCIKYNLIQMYSGQSDDKKEVLENLKSFLDLAECFTDEFSKKSLLAYLDSFLKESSEPLNNWMVPLNLEMFNKYSNHFSFIPSDEEIYVDVGAFDGDTALRFINATPTGKFIQIHAFEPNPLPRFFLKEKSKWVNNLNVYPYALSDIAIKRDFINDGMGSRALTDSVLDEEYLSRTSVESKTMDSIIEKATIIKIDTEGFEVPVINGAKRIIKESRPNLVVDTYHFPLDVLKIYKSVMAIHSYKFVAFRIYHHNLHSLFFSDTQRLF